MGTLSPSGRNPFYGSRQGPFHSTAPPVPRTLLIPSPLRTYFSATRWGTRNQTSAINRTRPESVMRPDTCAKVAIPSFARAWAPVAVSWHSGHLPVNWKEYRHPQ